MRTTLRAALVAGLLAIGGLGVGPAPARAQGLGYGGYGRYDGYGRGYDRYDAYRRGGGFGPGRLAWETADFGEGYGARLDDGFGRGRSCTPPPPPPPPCGIRPDPVRPYGATSYRSSYTEIRTVRSVTPYLPW